MSFIKRSRHQTCRGRQTFTRHWAISRQSFKWLRRMWRRILDEMWSNWRQVWTRSAQLDSRHFSRHRQPVQTSQRTLPVVVELISQPLICTHLLNIIYNIIHTRHNAIDLSSGGNCNYVSFSKVIPAKEEMCAVRVAINPRPVEVYAIVQLVVGARPAYRTSVAARCHLLSSLAVACQSDHFCPFDHSQAQWCKAALSEQICDSTSWIGEVSPLYLDLFERNFKGEWLVEVWIQRVLFYRCLFLLQAFLI